MANPDGYIHWYNRGWFDYTGTTLEQMQGWGWKSVHDPALVDAVVEKWTRSLQSGAAFELEFPLRRADGEFRWHITRAVPIRSMMRSRTSSVLGSAQCRSSKMHNPGFCRARSTD